MDFYSCISSLFLMAAAVAQRYKVVDFDSGYRVLNDYGITPSDFQLIFEVKLCNSYAGVYFMNQESPHSHIYFINIYGSNQGELSIYFNRIQEVKKNQNYKYGQNCNNFLKLKLGWKDGNFVLWQYDVSGWKEIFRMFQTTEGTLGYIGIRLSASNSCRVYTLEHTTSPHRVSCMKLT